MQETWVQSLGGEDTLEKEMATDSNILAWEIPWTEEQGDCETVGPDLATKQKMSLVEDYPLWLFKK